MKVMNIVSPATSQDLLFAGVLARTGRVIKVRTRATIVAGDTLTHMRVRTLNSYERERISRSLRVEQLMKLANHERQT